MSKTVIEIQDVEIVKCRDGAVLAHNIEEPAKGFSSPVPAIPISGWALEPSGPLATIVVKLPFVALTRVRPNGLRSDLEAAFPRVAGANASGFATWISSVGLPEQFELIVEGVCRSGARGPLGIIRGRHHPLLHRPQPSALSPLLLTTFGRTGSTWLLALLSHHPELVAYRPFDFEPRLLTAWLQAAQILSGPGAYSAAISGHLTDSLWWAGPDAAASAVLSRLEPEIRHRVSCDGVRESLFFAARQVEAFYERVAALQDKPAATHFIEKTGPTLAPDLARQLWPATREIVLVRDPRDVVCSVLAYDERRGYKSFGREYASSDEDFLDEMRLHFLALLDGLQRRGGVFVRYEDVVTDTAGELARICKHVGLASGPSVIETIITRAAAMPRESQRLHQTSATAEASIGRWRNDLPRHLRDACAGVFGDLLVALGYESAD